MRLQSADFTQFVEMNFELRQLTLSNSQQNLWRCQIIFRLIHMFELASINLQQ